jgi:hypothetical protein
VRERAERDPRRGRAELRQHPPAVPWEPGERAADLQQLGGAALERRLGADAGAGRGLVGEGVQVEQVGQRVPAVWPIEGAERDFRRGAELVE